MQTNTSGAAASIDSVVIQPAASFNRARHVRGIIVQGTPDESTSALDQLEADDQSGAYQRPEEFLSLAGLSRRLDIPETRATALLKAGVFTEDGNLDRTFLFRASRVEEIRAAVVAAKGEEK